MAPSPGRLGRACHPYTLHHAMDVVVQLLVSGSSYYYVIQSMPLKEVLTVYLPLVQEFVYDGLTKFAQSRFDVLQAHVDSL